MFKSQLIKSNHSVLGNTEQIPVERLFLHLIISATVLVAKMGTNHQVHSV